MNPRFTHDLERGGGGCVAGADEAGRGCLAGPLVAAAVVFDYACWTADDYAVLDLLNDSKKLTREQRAEVYGEVVARARRFAVVACSPASIDGRGLHVCNLFALDRALADVEDEAFDMDKRGSSWLLRASMTDALVAAQATPPWQDLLAAYQRRASHAELGGQSPTGLFRSASTQFEAELLRAWQEAMPEILGPGRAQCRVVRLVKQVGQGPALGNDAGIVYGPAPSFDISLPGAVGKPALNVRLGGETRLCATSDAIGNATLSFTCRAGISDATIGREDLWAFLDYVVLAAAGTEPTCPGHRGALFYSHEGKGKLHTLGFRALERERARDYLARLCADLLTGALDVNGAATGVHPYLLPHEAVLASQRHKTPLLDEIDELCSEAEGKGRSISSLQGPVPRVLDRYAAPTAQEAENMAKARFGLFFDLALEDRA